METKNPNSMIGWTRFFREEKGSITALFALFLPVAIISVGMVVDLGLAFTAQKCVQSASDLGALGGLQELDWQALAQGQVVIKEEQAKDTTKELIEQNLRMDQHLVKDLTIRIRVVNSPQAKEPGIVVDVDFRANSYFLRFLPGFEKGIPVRVHSEASIVERRKW